MYNKNRPSNRKLAVNKNHLSFLLLTATLTVACAAAPPSVFQRLEAGERFIKIRDEAILAYRIHGYSNKGSEAAATLLELAETAPGHEDWTTQFWATKIAMDLHCPELDRALVTAERALALAGDGPDRKSKSSAQLSHLNKTGGYVTFHASAFSSDPHDSNEILLSLSELADHARRATSGPNLTCIFDQVAERLEQGPVTLPYTVYLPFGDYLVNGWRFSHRNPETTVRIQ